MYIYEYKNRYYIFILLFYSYSLSYLVECTILECKKSKLVSISKEVTYSNSYSSKPWTDWLGNNKWNGFANAVI